MRSLLILVPLLCCGCEDAPGAPSAPPDDAGPSDADRFPDFDRPRPDGGPKGLEPGAPCAAGGPLCARGECTHGICSVVCARDADCPSSADRCIGRGGAGRCTTGCGEIADCAPGLICAVTGPEAGFCVAPGPGEAGTACANREDCASWFCADGTCLGRCDEAPCPTGRACLPLHTQAVCVQAGQGPDEASCVDGSTCATGLCRGGRCSRACPDGQCPHDRTCVIYEPLALCERRCETSAHCGPEALCRATAAGRLCATRGPRSPGEACATDEACASGRCAKERCATPCPDGRCPAGEACVVDASGPVCRIAGPGVTGAPCQSGADCESAVCGGGRCAAACPDGGGCPDGTRCTRFVDGSFCFVACEDDAGCPDNAYCDADFAEGPTCFWRGPRLPDDPCERDADCASGRCEARRCLQRCPDGACPTGRTCRDLGTAPLCASEPLPVNAACEAGDTCSLGLSCTAGRCLPRCDQGCPSLSVCHLGQCAPSCASDADCRPGRRCNAFDADAPFCEQPGNAADGAACDRSSSCASGLCFQGACRSVCDEGCPEGQACVPLASGRWCLDAGPVPLGGTCARDGECAAGLCVGRRCAAPCDAGACPEGTRCVALRGGDFCVVTCDSVSGEGCAADEVCMPEGGDGSGRCALADGGAPIDAPCAAFDECAPGAVACLDVGDGPRCRAPCAVRLGGCPEDDVCAPQAPADLLGACVPAGGGGDMQPCGGAADCASGWCLAAEGGGRCGRACAADADCGEGSRCVDLARDPAAPFLSCAPICDERADCPEGLQCRLGIDRVGACY